MAIGAVVFDLYGTLVDVDIDETSLARWQSLASRLRRSGVPVDEAAIDLRKQYGELLAVGAAAGRSGHMLSWVFRELLRSMGAEGSEDEIAEFARRFREATTESLELRDYTPRLISQLKGCGMRLGVLSNTEAVVTHFDLQRLDLVDAFDAIVLSSEVGSEKPSTEIYCVAMKRLGTSPEESIMVGDTWSTDVEGALRVGMRALHLNRDMASGSLATPDDAVISVHPDLDSIVGGLRQLGIPIAPPR